MKIVQRKGKELSLILMAETEEEKIIIQALRISGPHAIDVHRIFDDDVYEELVQAPAIFQGMVEYLSGNPELQSCGACMVDRETGKLNICNDHRAKWETEFIKDLVELELKVPCTCGLIEEDMPSYNPETGHSKDCLAPAMKKVKSDTEIPS